MFRVTKKFDKQLNKISRVEVLQVKNNGILFTTTGPRGLKHLSREYMVHQREYLEAQGELVSKAVDVASTYIPVIERSAQLIGKLDVLCSLAHAASNAPIPYIKPKVHFIYLVLK